MKDSQPFGVDVTPLAKYIKANNERFSTSLGYPVQECVSISRRIMKDSQHAVRYLRQAVKYIKANNERFSTTRHRTHGNR